LTARTSLIFKVEGLETGADDYVTKPFNSESIAQLKVEPYSHPGAHAQLFQDNEVLNIEPHRITLTSTDERFVQEALKSVEDNIDDAQYSIDDLIRA